jgi:hypothetical protein
MEKLNVRKTLIDKNGKVSFQYPDHYTNQQRGFSPAGSAKLFFAKMRNLGKSKPGRIISEREYNDVAAFKGTFGHRSGKNRNKRLIPVALHQLYSIN